MIQFRRTNPRRFSTAPAAAFRYGGGYFLYDGLVYSSLWDPLSFWFLGASGSPAECLQDPVLLCAPWVRSPVSCGPDCGILSQRSGPGTCAAAPAPGLIEICVCFRDPVA